jgi:hypothetical protein
MGDERAFRTPGGVETTLRVSRNHKPVNASYTDRVKMHPDRTYGGHVCTRGGAFTMPDAQSAHYSGIRSTCHGPYVLETITNQRLQDHHWMEHQLRQAEARTEATNHVE